MVGTAGAREALTPEAARLQIALFGAVQGVGFRPFVYQLATAMGLRGWVSNSPRGVGIEVEGPRATLERFRARLEAEKPVHAMIHGAEVTWLDPVGFAGFEIRPSEAGGASSTVVLPDLATCSACRREMFDPQDRRYRYPFTNCTHCGPRFSIVESLPYDRPRTSMRAFPMCIACRAEYDDPGDRRFHAQPNACPECGPELEFWDSQGEVVERREAALRAAAAALRRGEIVALKGLGGFQLLVDARQETAVQRLRHRKHREEKPLALLFPDLDSVRVVCDVSPEEEAALRSTAAPIVLLRRRRAVEPLALLHIPRRDAPPSLAPSVAPGNPSLGVMLPYTPLHHLLMSELGFPIVATSGNRSDEPICIDEATVLERLGGIADVFLVHNRPIVRHVDDSIVRVLLGREMVLRRARGYAPLPVRLRDAKGVRLAVGAHLKNTVALAVDESVFLSQHIGDLETPPAVAAFESAITNLRNLYPGAVDEVAYDAHPDYHSTHYSRGLEMQGVAVQHHCAHVAACMAENDLEGPVLGVAWDGTGYGWDGTSWGGEFLRAADGAFERVAALRPFRLPGGDRAAREPRRALLGVLFEMFGPGARFDAVVSGAELFAPAESRVLEQMLDRHLNSPWTSSAGRLFDAMAALTGLRNVSHFEGQAAMELEWAAEAYGSGASATNEPAYRMTLRPNTSRTDLNSVWAPCWILDWAPAVRAALGDRARDVPAGAIARRFHLALVDGIVQVARAAGESRIVLSGGCFQNALLTERTVHALEAAGFRPYWHQRVPPNDGGIALGQIAVATAQARHRRGRDHAKAHRIATAHPEPAAGAASTDPPPAP